MAGTRASHSIRDLSKMQSDIVEVATPSTGVMSASDTQYLAVRALGGAVKYGQWDHFELHIT